jgi:hypothetical protein
MRPVVKGSTDQSVVIRIVDSTDGTPETGVAWNTSGIDLWYRREGAAKVSITEATLSALTDSHSDGGVLHIGDGYYRLDLPDAAVASGANGVAVGGTVTGMVVIGCYVPLFDVNPYDAVRMGMSALPNAAAEASGGLITRGTGTGQASVSGGRMNADTLYWNGSAVAAPDTAGYPKITIKSGTGTGEVSLTSGIPAVNVTQIDGSTGPAANLKAFAANNVSSPNGEVITVTNLTNAPTAGDLTATMKSSVNTEVAAALNTYDGPTKAEMDARTIDSADYATASALGTVSTNVSTIEGRLTATRAGYLDNLNTGGVVASQADINALNQSASRRIILTTVGQYERPESSSTTFQIEARTYTADGAPVDADSTPTLTATGITSGSLAANLGSATNPSTGVYRWAYSVASSATLEQIRFDLSAVISSDTQVISVHSQVVDSVAATFTTADRTKVEAIYNKLPSKSYLTGTTNSDGDVQADEATGNFPGSVGSVAGAVGSVTAGVTVTTNNDKTGYALTSGERSSIAAAVRDVSNASPAADGLGDWIKAGAISAAEGSGYAELAKNRIGAPVGASLSADVAAVKTVADGTKAKTDQLAFTVANQVDANALTGGGSPSPEDITAIAEAVVEGINEEGVSLADGSITSSTFSVGSITGPASGILEQMRQLWRLAFKKTVTQGTPQSGTRKTYADDGTTVITTQAWNDNGSTSTNGDAT